MHAKNKEPLRIAITGLSGVVGQHLYKHEFLPQDSQIFNLCHSQPSKLNPKKPDITDVPIDLLDIQEIKTVLARIQPEVIIHLAALTHIDECERDRNRGEKGVVWRTNVEATKYFAQYCEEHNAQLVFMSTECVFDGEQKSYTESSRPAPKSWYGQSKAAAEAAISATTDNYAIIRAVVAYSLDETVKTLYARFWQELHKGHRVLAVGDSVFTPTYLDDAGWAIATLAKTRQSGIFHITPNEQLTPFAFAELVAHKNNFDPTLVHQTDLEALFGLERAQLRLRHAVLDSRQTQKTLHREFQSPSQVLKAAAK